MKFIVVALGLGLSAGALAHHSTQEYQGDMEMVAEITRVQWANPHLRLTVERQDGATGPEEWQLEAMDIASLARQGVLVGAIEPGVVVRLAGHPSTARDRRMFVTNVLLPDGVELLLRARTQPRWSERVVGGTFLDNESAIQTDLSDRPEGIFRVWVRSEINFEHEELLEPPLTDSAVTALSTLEQQDRSCDVIGMPETMARASGLHPFEFVQRDNQILIRLERNDVVRVIQMDGEANTDDQTSDPLGYSRGRWDGNTLIVTTTNIDNPISSIFRDQDGIPQSEEAKIIERFTLSEPDTRLTYDIEISDPVNLTRPVSADGFIVWEWVPGRRVAKFECED
jgi:hypothetical protein